MKKLSVFLLTFFIICSSTILDCVYAWDNFSVTEYVDTENLSPYSTYPSPTNPATRMTANRGMNYRGYGNVYWPATPPPLPFHKKLSASPDSSAYFFLMENRINTAQQEDTDKGMSSEPSSPSGAAPTMGNDSEQNSPSAPDTSSPVPDTQASPDASTGPAAPQDLNSGDSPSSNTMPAATPAVPTTVAPSADPMLPYVPDTSPMVKPDSTSDQVTPSGNGKDQQ